MGKGENSLDMGICDDIHDISRYLSDNNYVVGKLAGKGSYGSVIQAFDKARNQQVAIKCIPKIDDDVDFTKKIVREVLILNSLRESHILSLLDLQLNGNVMLIVTEFCETDLAKVIQSPSLSWRRTDYIDVLYQILRGVSYMHCRGVLHRDIKPANILVNSSLAVKICDFGLSRVVENCEALVESTAEPITEYMVTRWYRAPEIVLNPGKYGKAQDVWAVACTFAELLLKGPLFPGRTVVNQIQVIVNILGKPSENDLDFDMNVRARNYVTTLTSLEVGLEVVLAYAFEIHPNLFSLLENMLTFNPIQRITSDAALPLPIFQKFHHYNDGNSPSHPSAAADIKHIPEWPKSPAALLSIAQTEVRKIQTELTERRRCSDLSEGFLLPDFVDMPDSFMSKHNSSSSPDFSVSQFKGLIRPHSSQDVTDANNRRKRFISKESDQSLLTTSSRKKLTGDQDRTSSGPPAGWKEGGVLFTGFRSSREGSSSSQESSVSQHSQASSDVSVSSRTSWRIKLYASAKVCEEMTAERQPLADTGDMDQPNVIVLRAKGGFTSPSSSSSSIHHNPSRPRTKSSPLSRPQSMFGSWMSSVLSVFGVSKPDDKDPRRTSSPPRADDPPRPPAVLGAVTTVEVRPRSRHSSPLRSPRLSPSPLTTSTPKESFSERFSTIGFTRRDDTPTAKAKAASYHKSPLVSAHKRDQTTPKGVQVKSISTRLTSPSSKTRTSVHPQAASASTDNTRAEEKRFFKEPKASQVDSLESVAEGSRMNELSIKKWFTSSSRKSVVFKQR